MKILLIVLSLSFLSLTLQANEKIKSSVKLNTQDSLDFSEGVNHFLKKESTNFKVSKFSENKHIGIDKSYNCDISFSDSSLSFDSHFIWVAFKGTYLEKKKTFKESILIPNYQVYKVSENLYFFYSEILINQDFDGQKASYSIYIELGNDSKTVRTLRFEVHKQALLNEGTVENPNLEPKFIKNNNLIISCIN